MKSLKVSEKNWKKLMIAKLKYGYVSVDEMLEKFLQNSNSLKKEDKKNEKSN